MQDIGTVVCAIIERGELFLLAQRPITSSIPYKWEFPGGKVDQDETEEAALRRELKEELGIDIEILQRLTPHYHVYEGFSINLVPFRCTIVKGRPVAREHAQISWVNFKSIEKLDLADADIAILEEYQLMRGGTK